MVTDRKYTFIGTTYFCVLAMLEVGNIVSNATDSVSHVADLCESMRDIY